MSKETIQINVATLTKQVEDGWKKDALAKHYGIPVSQMGTALKQAGLKIRKLHKPAFVLVTDEVVTEKVEAVEGDVNAAEAKASVEEQGPGPIANEDVTNSSEATSEVPGTTETPTWK